MNKMVKLSIFTIFFYIGFLLFMPKENLFFAFQRFMHTKDIFINCDLKKNPLTLGLFKGTLYVHKIDLARFEKAQIKPWIFYNTLIVKKLTIGNKDVNIPIVHVSYTPFNPLRLTIEGKSDFGVFKGTYDLKTKKISLLFSNVNPNKLPPFITKKKGGYYFETTL